MDSQGDTPVLRNITESMVPQCIQIYSQSFIKQNPLWQKLKITQQQAEKSLKLKLKYAVGTQSSFVMINEKNGEIAALTITIDILDYIKYLQEQANLQKSQQQKINSGMKILNKYGMQAERAIFEAIGQNYQRRQYLYNFGAATNPKYAKSKVTSHFWYLVTEFYNQVGYKAIFCRASTRLTTRMMGKLGGKVISQLKFREQELSQEKFQVIQLSFRKYKAKL